MNLSALRSTMHRIEGKREGPVGRQSEKGAVTEVARPRQEKCDRKKKGESLEYFLVDADRWLTDAGGGKRGKMR